MTLLTSLVSDGFTHHTAKLRARQPAYSRLKPVLHWDRMRSVGLAVDIIEDWL
jgi:hypothetical protein